MSVVMVVFPEFIAGGQGREYSVQNSGGDSKGRRVDRAWRLRMNVYLKGRRARVASPSSCIRSIITNINVVIGLVWMY